MDGELLRWLYHRLLHDPKLAHTRGCTYADGVILLVYLYGSMCHRSPRWACRRGNWPACYRRVLHLPSYSQLNKRLRTQAVRRHLAAVDQELRERLGRSDRMVGDGKPLVVGGYSHDPDARRGKTPGGWGRGYKLHVIADAVSGAIEAWALTPLDAGEATVLREALIPRVDLHGCLLRCDANYDSNPCYAAAADAGGRMVAQRRKPGTGIGHHAAPQHPDRLRAIDEVEHTPDGLREHQRARAEVERVLARLTNLPFGLTPLPNFVRRLERVRLWVAAKILLYHLHLATAATAAAAA